MNNVLVPIWSRRGKLCLPGAVLVAVLASGCGGFLPNPDDGEPDAKQGEYRVKLETTRVRLSAANSSLIVDVSVSCEGNPKPQCPPNFNPAWEVTNAATLNVFTDFLHTEDSEEANLRLGLIDLTETESSSSLIKGVIWYSISVVPTNKPPKLRLTGQRRIDIEAVGDTIPRIESPPGKPVLTLSPLERRFVSRVNGQPVGAGVAIIYRGPATTLTAVDIVDFNIPQKFTVSALVGVPLDGNTHMLVFVNFLGGTVVGSAYDADLIVQTENGASAGIPLYGTVTQ